MKWVLVLFLVSCQSLPDVESPDVRQKADQYYISMGVAKAQRAYRCEDWRGNTPTKGSNPSLVPLSIPLS